MSARVLTLEELQQLAMRAVFRAKGLAELLSVSDRQLRRDFRAHLDTSAGHWLRQFRWELIKAALVQGLSNQAIVRKFGFSSDRDFRRVVRKWSGTSPQGFRSRNPTD